MATKITDSILLNWFGSDHNKKQMFLSVPGGPDVNEGGVLFLECVDSGGDADGGLFIFTDGTDLRYSTTKPTNTNTGGSALGTSTTSALNRYMSNLEPTRCNTSIISDTDSTDDLGSSTYLWANAYVDKVWLNATAAIDGTTTGSSSTVAGNWQFGVDGTGVDVILYGDTAGTNITWDMTADALIFTDDAELILGDGSDCVLVYDGTSLDLDLTADEMFNIGLTNNTDVTLHGATGGSDIVWDASADTLTALDDVKLAFGDSDDMYFMYVSGNTLSLLQTSTGVGSLLLGVDGKGVDTTWYAETASDYMMWDQDGNTNVGALIFEDSVIQFAGNAVTHTIGISTDELLFDGTDGANCGITFGTAGTHGMDVLFQSITAGDTIAFDAGGKTLTFADCNLIMGAEYIQFHDSAVKVFSSADTQLDIDADGEVEITTALVEIAAAATTMSGTLAVTGAQTNTLGIQNASVARTATADGTTTGTIADGSTFVTVTSDDANKIIILPTPTPGNVVWLAVAATGYELRSSAPNTVAINGGTDTNGESNVGANVLVRAVCTSATTWICSQFSSAGTESACTVAAD